MDNSLLQQLAARDSLRRKLNWAKTPEQRMQEMARLQEQMWETLRQSPEGMQRFLRRNYKARAINPPKIDGN